MSSDGLVHNLSLVHALLALGAIATVFLVVREISRTYVSQWGLFTPCVAGLFVAGVLFLTQIAAGMPLGIFLGAAGAGLLIGILRGLTTGLQADRYSSEMAISRSAGLTLLGLALGLALCAVLEIVGAYVESGMEKLRFWAALSAMVLATAMLARASVLAIRSSRHD